MSAALARFDANEPSPASPSPAAYYDGTPRPYRLVFNARGDFSTFRTFDEVVEHLRFTRVSAVAIINDDLTDGGKRQGLTEEEYEWALEGLR